MRRLALALALVTVAFGLRFGTFAASGADSYAYVSQADLWLRGTLIVDEPLYAVLDDWEREVFRSRYAAVTDISWLDRPPLVVASGRVYFYAVRTGYN